MPDRDSEGEQRAGKVHLSNTLRRTTTWLTGLFLGTVIIGVTSPLFVRSYVAEVFDPNRGVNVLSATDNYRWRAEGYATSVVGEHGMVGRKSLPVEDAEVRIALWGDSQAEGVCVADAEKLFTQIEHSLEADSLCVLPFARSGDDAADWLTQMPIVEQNMGIDAHVVLIVEMSDLHSAADTPVAVEPAVDESWQSFAASSVPAFVIQGVRHLLTSAEGYGRRLRFSIGPVSKPVTDRVPIQLDVDWTEIVGAIKQRTNVPVIVVFAPAVPSVSYGVVELVNRDQEQFLQFETAATSAGLSVVDTSDDLGEAARQGLWPRGFHNGQIGIGHLNANGYRVIAQRLSPVIGEVLDGR